LGLSGSGYEEVASLYEDGKEPAGFIKFGGFVSLAAEISTAQE
jgi:hypothetical protein